MGTYLKAMESYMRSYSGTCHPTQRSAHHLNSS